MPLLLVAAGWIVRIFPIVLKVAPWIITIFSFIAPFSDTVKGWMMSIADAVLPSISISGANFGSLPSDLLTAINTFAPVDTIFAFFSAYVPFFLACLAHRMAKSLTPTTPSA